MESRWQDADANSQVAQRPGDCNEDLALRVYTSRLIGRDAELVLHGGGNTSVKTRVLDLLGEEREVICVKGSGWDLASIEAPGLPALDLPGLRRLRELEELSDGEMLNQLRTHLLDASAPTPSVETLLHAFLPDKFVDHTHADAALVFGNRPEGAGELEELFGGRVGVLPWIMPGFPLAKRVARYREENPDSIGLVLHMHGVFSWGEHARESYERMIEIVDRIERAIRERLEGRKVFPDAGSRPPEDELRAAAVDSALALRRFTSVSSGDELDPLRPMILEWRPSDETLAAAEAPATLFRMGPLTPDHAIRTKGWYVVTEREEEAMALGVAGFTSDYVDYFTRFSRGRDPVPQMLDPFPRVVLVKGAGLFAFGRTKRDARISADIAEHTIRGKLRSAALSDYVALTDAELFEMEYWSLEQAKLGKAKEPPLGRKIALVSGAAGAIGFATA
ncbi:MAG: class II aldolase/adducin family protein, partial [Planctomycetota bacterium]